MIRITANIEAGGRLELGELLRVRLERLEPEIETRCFLRHDGILYPEPLRGFSLEEGLEIYPEAPGSYVLRVEWRAANGCTEGHRGFEDWPFRVKGGGRGSAWPRRVRLADDTVLWMPTGWDAAVATQGERTSLERLRSVLGMPTGSSERRFVELLGSLLEPGATVYDVGANVGLHALPMARRIEPGGRLFCIEPNPVCIHFLRANLALHGLENVEILPFALAEKSGEIPLKLNYGNANLGLVAGDSGFYFGKAGHQIKVPCRSFDDLLDEFHLPPPDLIKIDVEGAEAAVLRGARRHLEKYRPPLALELHHEACARLSLEWLDELGYRYVSPSERREMSTADEVLQYFGSTVFQLLALPG